MPEPLGARLRRRREEQQIALSSIAERTKISVALLEGLERDDVSRWPSGIFRRAFVRAYAAAIGLEPEAVVREFLERYPDPDEAVALPVNGAAVPVDDAAGETSGLTRLMGRFRRRPSETVLPSVFGLSDGDRTVAEPPAPPRSAPGPVDVGAIPAEPAAADPPNARATVSWQPDLDEAARLCTELGRVSDAADFSRLLSHTLSTLGATGLILWVWESGSAKLWPALGHGYSPAVLAQIPPLEMDARNATVAAFRGGEPSVVAGTPTAHGALAVPILAAQGCAGVLAIEFSEGREQNRTVRALATIVAAQIAPLIASQPAADASRKLA